jgi:hypothetical protein
MNRTQKQNEIVNFLEGLLQNRFSLKSLNEKLSTFFECKIECENNTQIRLDANDFDCDEDLPNDWNLMFNVEDGTEQSGFYDIYMLPMRRKGFSGEDMYITEVGYEFI